MFYQSSTQYKTIATHVRNITDVSGAGDTVIAVASVIYATTKNIDIATKIANVAAGIVCEEVGTVAINKQHLLSDCLRLLQ